MTGLLDSGLGGLTVLRQLRAAQPEMDFLYLGDLARLPYGIRSREVLQKYVLAGVEFLVAQGASSVILACHTASALTLPWLQEQVQVPVEGVLQPVLEQLHAIEPLRNVLVLGTEATVRSEAYPRGLADHPSRPRVFQRACPLLVELAEEGWWNHPVTEAVIREYAKPFLGEALDGVVLACTHFPLLRGSLERVFPNVPMWEAGQILAEKMKQHPVLGGGKGTCRFFATDRVRFHHTFEYGEPLSFELVDPDLGRAISI